PSFGGQKDMTQALKVVAYSWTASWIAGIAVILPWIGWLIALAGAIYAIYLLYLGLPSTMKCPPEKAGGYTAVSVIIAVVLSWIIGLIVAGVVGTAMLGGAAMGGMHLGSSDSGNVSLDSNSALGKLAAMGQRAEQAGKDMDAAQKSGDSAAQSAAMGKMMGAMAGGGNVEALPPEQIKAFLPDSLGDLKRTSLSAQRNAAMGMQVSEADAEYVADNGRHIRREGPGVARHRDGAGRGEADRARLREDLQRQRQPGPRTMGHPVEVRRIRRAGGPALLGEGERQRRQHRPAEAGGGQRRPRQAGRAEGRRREGK